MDISKLYINLDVVLSKRATLDKILPTYEIKAIESKAAKNNWSDSTIVEYIYRYLKENIQDTLDASDFLDSSVIIESDPYIIRAMRLMEQSQRDAEKLIIDKEYKYPGCWVNDIAEALRNLECNDRDRELMIWSAYYNTNWEKYGDIPGWAHLADILETYYDTL